MSRPGFNVFLVNTRLLIKHVDHLYDRTTFADCLMPLPLKQTETTSSSPPPSTLRSCTCARTSLLWCPAVWPTHRPRCPCTEKSLQRRSCPIRRWWPMTPPRGSSCRTPPQIFRGSSTVRLWPKALLRSPRSTSCSMWRVGIHPTPYTKTYGDVFLSLWLSPYWLKVPRTTVRAVSTKSWIKCCISFQEKVFKSPLTAELGLRGRLPADTQSELMIWKLCAV